MELKEDIDSHEIKLKRLQSLIDENQTSFKPQADGETSPSITDTTLSKTQAKNFFYTLDDKRAEKIPNMIKDAVRVQILGRTAVNLLGQYQKVFEQLGRGGCEICLLFVDPLSEASKFLYGGNPEIYRNNIISASHHVKKLKFAVIRRQVSQIKEQNSTKAIQMKWENIININEVEFEAWSAGENYQGQAAELSKTIGTQKLGFHIEILSPKKFSCPYHFHHSEEELFLVLEGKAMLRQNNQYKEVTSGDLIHFKTTPADAHQFYNHTEQDFKFLALSTRDELDIVEYPDSRKILFRKNDKIFQVDTEVPYITDEENPSLFWEEKFLDYGEHHVTIQG